LLSLQVLNWYEATDVNLRRGVPTLGKATDYIVDADHIVQAVPLQQVQTDENLERQLRQNKVVLIELKEVFTNKPHEEKYEEVTQQL
jgi:hypothetical protein